MEFLDLTLPTAAENLALDEALLLQAEAGEAGSVLRLWEWPALAVVLGSGGKLAEDVNEENCARDGVPLLRRSSGGGTVLLGAGCLCYSLVLPFALDERLTEIRPSYQFIGERVLAGLGLASGTVAGISDLALGQVKFSGNAQQRKRDHVLHHGTLLYSFDLPKVSRYLREPTQQPEYRAGREHAAFVCNLDLSRARLAAGLRQAWDARVERTNWPIHTVARLVDDKFGREDWVRRR